MRGTRYTGHAQERKREVDEQTKQIVKQVQVGYVMRGSGWSNTSYEGQKKSGKRIVFLLVGHSSRST